MPCSSDDSPSAPRDPHVPAEADVPAAISMKPSTLFLERPVLPKHWPCRAGAVL
ncbi:hypothetical protein ALP29_02859 [Pseudomonas syringae pv. avii]|uniref:Uncharacterized protein n=2 Tax=Pseudomonas syringae group TaxID=136849 RepID=A0A3M5THL2_9PSED|nr:hypothetical protein ALQ90_01961 [Pseudomonas savastanoi pv. savastanoi]RMU32999.1 hypothetical protein ALP32_02050 [Pseudomonas avellanae]RMU55865.1 hypothetical protein ALP29_02859 [Pseudomonas syringae pv. avii]